MSGAKTTSRTSPARRAAEAVELVAERLADPDAVAAVADRPDNSDPIYGSVMWAPLTLSTGYPGTALLYAELAARDQKWMPTLHRHIRAAAESMSGRPSRGLYAGPAALLAAAQAGGGHYPGLRRNLASWLAQDQLTRLRACRAHPGPGVSWEAYDIVNGLSGTARLLLDSIDDPAETGADVEQALRETLHHLVAISEPIVVDGRTVPGWWVPAEYQAVEQDRLDYPRGDFNLGLAHGIPGPLLVCSLALRRGYEVPGQREALHRMVEWLLSWARTDESGTYWPCRVGFDDEVAESRSDSLFTRTAWCYGAPGVAAAVHHAGCTLDNAPWRSAAVAALRDALARDESKWTLAGPTVCHGYAGLLRIVDRVGGVENDPVLTAAVPRLADKIVDMADTVYPFIFQHAMRYPHAAPGPTEFKMLDVAGVLEGAAGVACALLSIVAPDLAGGSPGPSIEEKSWDRVIALS